MGTSPGKYAIRGLRLCSENFNPQSSESEEIVDQQTKINKRGLTNALQMQISRSNPHSSRYQEIGDRLTGINNRVQRVRTR